MALKLSFLLLLKPISYECQYEYYKHLEKKEYLHDITLEVLPKILTLQHICEENQNEEDKLTKSIAYIVVIDATPMEKKYKE